jgi:hypothetical protein
VLRHGLRDLSDFMGKDATVWIRATHPHTNQGNLVEVGDVYLVRPDMVETICDVLKWAVRDNPPQRAVRRPKAEP